MDSVRAEEVLAFLFLTRVLLQRSIRLWRKISLGTQVNQQLTPAFRSSSPIANTFANRLLTRAKVYPCPPSSNAPMDTIMPSIFGPLDELQQFFFDVDSSLPQKIQMNSLHLFSQFILEWSKHFRNRPDKEGYCYSLNRVSDTVLTMVPFHAIFR